MFQNLILGWKNRIWDKRIEIISALLSLAGCFSFPEMLPPGSLKLIYTNSVFSIALFTVLIYFLYKALKIAWISEKKQWRPAICFSFLFSICMAFGTALEEKENVDFTDSGMWLAIAVWGVIIALLVSAAWKAIGNSNRKVGKFSNDSENIVEPKNDTVKELLKYAIIIFICWLPVFLAVYPGFFVYDAQDEWVQAATREFTSHHPLIHVLLLGGIIQAVHKFSGSYNLGIACYTLFQMCFLSAIFSYAILYMRQKKISLSIRLTTLLYFGLFPVIVMFSLCSAKDGLFTGAVLILFLMIKELIDHPEWFLLSKIKQILFILSAAGVMLLRHNGKYAFWIMAVILFFYFHNNQRKKILQLTAASIIIYIVFSSGLSLLFHAEKGGRQEMLTVPIQQIARVYESEIEHLSFSELEAIYEFIPEKALRRYVPKVSDGVKIDFNNKAFAENSTKFLKLWTSLGIKHPFTYLNAWFMTSYGFWYPDTILDAYKGNTVFTYTYEDSSYFGYEVEQPGTRESKIPWLAEYYRRLSLEITQQKVPVISMLFSPGFLFWVMMFVIGCLWQEKRIRRLLPYLLPLLIWLTVALGPASLVRYVLFLWVLLPFMLLELFTFDRSACPCRPFAAFDIDHTK